MIHKKGSENINADALSRAKHLDEPTAEENVENQIGNEVGEMKIAFMFMFILLNSSKRSKPSL